MAVQRCPGCGLIHTPSATRCECGHVFGQLRANRLAAGRLAADQDATLWSLWLGALLVAAGGALVVGTFVSGDGPRILWYGPIVVGLSLLARAWVRRGELRKRQDSQPEAVAESQPTDILGRPELWHKVIGHRCVDCDKNIFAIEDGDLCATCARPVHRACADPHRAIHAAAPYR